MTKRRQKKEKLDLSKYEYPLPGSENAIRAVAGMLANMHILQNEMALIPSESQLRAYAANTIQSIERMSLARLGRPAAASTNNWNGWCDIFTAAYKVTYRACGERYTADPARHESDLAHVKEVGENQYGKELSVFYEGIYTTPQLPAPTH